MDPQTTALAIVAMLIVGALLALLIVPRGAKVEVDAKRRRFTIDTTRSVPKKRKTKSAPRPDQIVDAEQSEPRDHQDDR